MGDRHVFPLLPGDLERVGDIDIVGRMGSASQPPEFLGWLHGEPVRLTVWPTSSDRQPQMAEASVPHEISGGAVLYPAAVGRDEGRLWSATTMSDREWVADVIDDEGPLNEEAWWSLARDLGTLLRSVHEADAILGDFTAGDVVVDDQAVYVDNSWRALARAHGDTVVAAPPLAWLTPDHLDGTEQSPQCDIFRAGLVLAYAGTGRPPFGADSTPASVLVSRVSAAEVDVEGLDSKAEELLRGMLERDPARRMSAATVVSVLAPPPPPPPLPPKSSPPDGVDGSPWDPEFAFSPGAFPEALDQGAAEPTRPRTALLVSVVGGAAGIGLLAALIVLLGHRSSTQAADSELPSTAFPTGATSSVSASAAAPPVPTARVVYVDSKIPTQTNTGVLDWTFDVCFSDGALVDPGVTRKIAMYRKDGTRWIRLTTMPRAVMGGRCGEGKVDVLIDGRADQPNSSTPLDTWTPCVIHRVITPETTKFKKTYIDFCVQTQLSRGGAA